MSNALEDLVRSLAANPNPNPNPSQVFERTMALEMVDVPNGLVFTGEVCIYR